MWIFVTKACRGWQLFKSIAYRTTTWIYPPPSLSHDEPYLWRMYLEDIDAHTYCAHTLQRHVYSMYIFFNHLSTCAKSDSKHTSDTVWVAVNTAGIMRPTYWWTDPAAFKSLWHKANPTRYESQSNRHWGWAMRGSSSQHYFHTVAHQCTAQWSLSHLPGLIFQQCSVCVDNSLAYKVKSFSINSLQSQSKADYFFNYC